MKLSIALDRYDRHYPFFDGTVTPPDGVELDIYQVGQSQDWRDGDDRHERMLHKKEFDVAEFSMSSFLMAKGRGLPIVGIPVFPRRLFSQSQMWVHPDSDLWEPNQLPGKKIALSSFQTTLSLLAKGDLKFHYGVNWEDIHWLLTTAEKVKFEPKPGVKIDFLGDRENLGNLLEAGEIDGFFLPHPPKSVTTGKTRARRLFRDPQAEEEAYYKKYGDFPIMHVMTVQEDLLAKEPWIARAVLDMCNQAWEISDSYYEDPNWSRLAWGRHAYEEQWARLPGNPWRNGFKENRDNIERFIKYSHDQGLIDEPFAPETLFAEDTLDS